MSTILRLSTVLLFAAPLVVISCGGSSSNTGNAGGAAGSSGDAGVTGGASSGGTGGSTGGSTSTGGSSGSAGAGGVPSTGGSGTGGASGTAGAGIGGTSGGAGGAAGSTSTAGAAGTLGGAGTAGAGGAPPQCQGNGDCNDNSPCTTDACVSGQCVNTAVADGPLGGVDDPNDCRNITCTAGVLSDVADNSENPADANPPCELTVCKNGAPTPSYASSGTVCGDPPLKCDGAGHCKGCTGTVAGECGAATQCATPYCNVADGTCAPGYTATDPPDPTAGDCKKLDCTGTAPTAATVPDDGDQPVDLACSDRGCQNGTVVAPILPAGVACLGQSGVCDGLGSAATHCHVCADTKPAYGLDAGCTTAKPRCNPSTFVCEVPWATWDPTWSVAGATYANGNLSVSGSAANTENIRTTVGRTTGKYYFEITATAGDGTTDAGGLGLMESVTPNTTSWIGSQDSGISWGYGSCCAAQYWYTWTGVTVSASPPPLASAVKAGIVYMFALDLTGHQFWAGYNGTWFGSGNPSTGVNPVATGLSGTIYPGVTLYAGSIDAFTANFGQSAFVYPVPTGFDPGFY